MRRFLSLLTVLMLCGAFAFAQTKTVSGTVTDNLETPLAGVTVQVNGTKIGGITNSQGAYSIDVPASATSLNFSSIGFIAQKVPIPSNGMLSIQMQPSLGSLEEVIVTAQGLKTSVKASGAAQTSLNAEQLTNAQPTNVSSALSGKVAGLVVAGVGSGVNPTYRLTLRGMRSLLGDNQALVVLDNVIVPSSILGNLNPQDIEGITVLNGSSAAALYGSDGSNGALIITTKRGSDDGKLSITLSNTATVETVGIMPQFQKEYGSGTNTDIVSYTPFENQQYGPHFDGTLRPIGLPIQGGEIMKVPYQWAGKKGKEHFWKNGFTNQTDISLANNFDKGSLYFAAQYLDTKGTVPGDKYNRATVRLNGVLKLDPKVELNYSTYYAQNRYNTAGQASNIYENVLNTPGEIPLTEFDNWKTDSFANPNGYYNAYYMNPYFLADNYRSLTRNDYFVGSVAMTYRPIKMLDITYRMGFNTRNFNTDGTADKFIFSDYTKALPDQKGTYKASDILGGYSSSSGYVTNIISDLIAHTEYKINDFKFDLTGAGNISQSTAATTAASIDGLVVPGIFNISNSLTPPGASNAFSQTRSVSLWGKFDVAFRNYLYVTITGRNDWFSTLAPDNRSFFYPSAQLSFVPTDAFVGLKNIKNLDYFKVRGSLSKVGQVNIDPYKLKPIFGQSSGFPYSGQGGFTIGSQIVAPGLKPEITKGYEAGFDVSLYQSRIRGAFTYYSSTTSNQTLSTGVSSATGFTSYLLNVGETSSKGVEASLTVVPYRSKDWFVSVGAVYSFYDNKVVSINADIDKLTIASYGGTVGAYAVAGEQFPVIMGTTHERDSEGHIIVNPITGYPSATTGLKILGRAGAKNEIGLNLEVTFKSLTLAATAAYRGGAVIYNALGTTFDFSGAGINTVAYDRDRFVIPNSVIPDPNNKGSYIPNTNVTIREGGAAYWPQATNRTGIDENYVTSADFWKLREVSLTYNLPNKWFANGRAGIKGLSLSLQGRNLISILPKTEVYTDPEFSTLGSGSNAIGLTDLGQLPPSRYMGGTLTIKF